MGIKCCVSGCTNIYKKKKHQKLEEDHSFLSFHRFPKNLDIQSAWISNVRQINGSNWQPINSSFVCSEHFYYSSWETNREDGKRRLKFQAVPSIFNNFSQNFQNDHNYSQTSMKNINSWIFSSIERNPLYSSVHDHTYASKAVSNNGNSFISAAKPIKETSVTTSTDITEKNISNISQIESGFTNNGNSNNVLNYSDVLTNSCTASQNNTLNLLPELMVKVENAITAQTIKEQDIDIIALKKENEQLKKELRGSRKLLIRYFNKMRCYARIIKNYDQGTKFG